jgi:basic amino acid/polyamine antiporter, APA family
VARRKRREGHSLHKVLGVGALFSTAYGNVGSSIYYALGVVAAAALGLTPLVFVITGVLFIATAWSYSEATAAMPEAGGASSFTRRAFNEFASFGVGWAQMLTYTATIAISALFVPQYLSIFWPILKEPPYNVIGGAIVIVVLVVINIIGIKEAASLNVVLALLDLGTQVLIMIIALVLLLEPNILLSQIRWGIAPTWGQFLYGLAIGTVAYTGIETISNMAEEAHHPGRDVPRSINFVIVAVLVVYIGMPLAALSSMEVGFNQVTVDPATGRTVPLQVVPGTPEGTFVLKSDPTTTVYVPVEQLPNGTWIIPQQKPTGPVQTISGELVTQLHGSQLGSNYEADPVLGMVRFLPDNIAWLRWILGPWVGILAATILFIATNAGIIGVSRLAFSLGQHRQLPRVLGRVHPTRLTPYVAIALFGVIAVILILPGEIPLLAELYAFGSMISFTAAHISVIVLRRREPDLPRPFRPPFNVRFRGVSVPMTAVFGALGTLAVWCVILYYKPLSGFLGIAWVAVGLVGYVIFRKVQGYSLTKTVRSPDLPASLQEDVVYDQLLVPVRDTVVSEEMMVLACQLATERKSSIDALYVIEVPLNLPIDASLPEERERARQVLERSAQAADMFNVKLTPVVVTARSAGRAIVEEAIARRSEVIVLGSQSKRRIADKVFGRTIDYVLDNLPCEAIINVVPKHAVTARVEAGTGVVSVVTPAPVAAQAAPGPMAAQAAPAQWSAAASSPAAEAEAGPPDRARRRAQGLRLGRYLPARRGGEEAPSGNGNGSGPAGLGGNGSKPELDQAAAELDRVPVEPDRVPVEAASAMDPGRRDPGAA